MEYEVCLTLLHLTCAGNQIPDLLILSPTSYTLGPTTVRFCIIFHAVEVYRHTHNDFKIKAAAAAYLNSVPVHEIYKQNITYH